MKLKLTHFLENLPNSLIYWMAIGDCRSWLYTQVILDVVYYFCGLGEDFFLVFAGIKKIY